MPTEFLPGKVFGSGRMKPIDYSVAHGRGPHRPPANLDLATIQQRELANDVSVPYSAISRWRRAQSGSEGLRGDASSTGGR